MAQTSARTGAWYGLARTSAWVAVVSIVLIVAATLFNGSFGAAGVGPSPPGMVLAISALTLAVSICGTTSSILLGWRAERRQSAEFKLRIEQLERELAASRGAMVGRE